MIFPRLHAAAPEPSPAPEKFEDLLARLEQIVSDMESADLPLEKLLSSYEEGMRLVKACGDRLLDAEQKVEILSRSVAAAPSASSTAPPIVSTGDTKLAEGEEEIRLI
jgi:exodeoxyribonuclease VII small subunit